MTEPTDALMHELELVAAGVVDDGQPLPEHTRLHQERREQQLRAPFSEAERRLIRLLLGLAGDEA